MKQVNILIPFLFMAKKAVATNEAGFNVRYLSQQKLSQGGH